MEVYRISIEAKAHTLASSGASNRWNIKDQFVIYTGSSRSLSTLELFVHLGGRKTLPTFKVMIISIDDETTLYSQILEKDLPVDWRHLSSYPALQNIGSNWYTSKSSLVLKIPSAIIPQEFNYVLNTQHPDFLSKVRLVRLEDYFWDPRLLNMINK